MWSNLPKDQKQEYERLIKGFASLTDAFAQKNEEGIPAPIMNSKYQESAFAAAFHAVEEDISNSSFDSSIRIKEPDGRDRKYLVGLKTFGIGSGDQKIAQFKSSESQWTGIISRITRNAERCGGSKERINEENKELYKDLAQKISEIRNALIDSSMANLRGFTLDSEKDEVESVYHVLMPSKRGDEPKIYVGETSYTPINTQNIKILGCTMPRNPSNFSFTDGEHKYKYTSADCQLYMSFDNKDIVLEAWDIQYVEDALGIFREISDSVYGKQETGEVLLKLPQAEITESYIFKLSPQPLSGFNAPMGFGFRKMDSKGRRRALEIFKNKYENQVGNLQKFTAFFLGFSLTREK